MSNVVFAQKYPGLALKINFLSPIMGAATLHTEAAVNDKNSINLVACAGFRNYERNGVQGWSISAELRHYTNGSPTNGGFYIAPFMRYRDFLLWGDSYKIMNGDTTFYKSSFPFNTISGGIIVGKQWLIGKYILIDLFAGPEINSKSFKEASNKYDAILQSLATAFWVRSGATIGIKLY